MIITKRHLSRRTVLKGMGVTAALPFLDAMTPAATALAKTAAKGKVRFVAIEMVARRRRQLRLWRCRTTCGRRPPRDAASICRPRRWRRSSRCATT